MSDSAVGFREAIKSLKILVLETIPKQRYEGDRKMIDDKFNELLVEFGKYEKYRDDKATATVKFFEEKLAKAEQQWQKDMKAKSKCWAKVSVRLSEERFELLKKQGEQKKQLQTFFEWF